MYRSIIGRTGAAARGLWTATLLALAVAGASAPASLPTAPPRSFELIASRFKFEPDTVEVTEGDHVRLTVRSIDTEHGLTIKRLNVKIVAPKTGEAATAEFVADKAGIYEFKCSEYCGSGHGRMKGQLVVSPKAR